MEAGRPKKYKSAKAMQREIDKYFKDCEGHPLMVTDPDTGEEKPMLDKYGNPIILDAKPLTVTGLALALGFSGRQSLLNYSKDSEFFDTITRAKARIEEYTEMRLFDKDGVNGAKFSLANNFGWSEKQEIGISGKEDKPFEINIKVVE